MNIFLKRAQPKPLSYFSHFIDDCLSSKSLELSNFIHAQLLKVGFNRHTFLGNRLIDLYSKLGFFDDAIKSFEDIANKNIFSWNIFLKLYIKYGELENARKMFDEMPDRDVVSWNSIISGFSSNGYFEDALELFRDMQDVGIPPDNYTYSVAAKSVKSPYHGKQIHGKILRAVHNELNLVVGNSLIDMYGAIGLVDYAFGVFLTMEDVDIISWNSIISSCCQSGKLDLGLNQFGLMIFHGYSPDAFTSSIVISICTSLQDLKKGTQIFGLSIKFGFVSNTIFSSAVVDMFSKCDRLESAIKLFEEINVLDIIICNSMVSSYVRHGYGVEALKIFLHIMRENLRPTEFTISSVLNAASSLGVAEQGSQIHSLVVKLGIENDMVVASSLLHMYAKYGIINFSKEVFTKMKVKDLISYNTMIFGLSQSGRSHEALDLFEELLHIGLFPDHISLLGVLMASCYGGLFNKGMGIFLSMERAYGIYPRERHYLSIIDMVIRVGKLREALDIAEAMPYEPSSSIWESILCGCGDIRDLKLIEKVAKRLIESKPLSSLPYLILARAYEKRGKWESIVRVRKAMKENNVKTVTGYSWIGIGNHISIFEANHLFHQEDVQTYFMLKLLVWEMNVENMGYDKFDDVGIV